MAVPVLSLVAPHSNLHIHATCTRASPPPQVRRRRRAEREAVGLHPMAGRSTLGLIATTVLVVLQVVAARPSSAFTDAMQPGRMDRKAKGMDVLMLAIDDLRAQQACSSLRGYDSPEMATPHLCELAKKSLMLQRSHVTMATCGPSRASLLTSRHPTTTRVWDTSSYWRNVSGNFTTIPQYFKEEGYLTAGMGKLFHPGSASGAKVPNCGTCRGSDDADYSWTEPYFTPKKPLEFHGHEHAWLAVPHGSEPLEDEQTRDHAVATLEQIAQRRLTGSDDRAFFVAVGFRKPHLPFVFPKRFLDHYPSVSDIELPSNPFPPEDMPRVAWNKFPETRHYDDIKALRLTGIMGHEGMPKRKAKELRRAYYAAVSFADSNCGHVLAALRHTGLQENTVVVVWSDHGWSLGEHGLWDKVERRRLKPVPMTARPVTAPPTCVCASGSTQTSTSIRARR